ncbi:hypothetical protein NMG60_11015798, partial [Bertholletia excelsa]
LNDEALQDCFISGLKPEIKREIIVHSPTSLLRAIALTKLFDDNYISSSAASKPRSSSPALLPFKPASLLPSAQTSDKQLSPAKMQLRHDKGLCYPCDEKFSPTHRCPNRQFFLLQYDDDPLQRQLHVKLSKCDFGTDQIHYLGHVAGAVGVSMDPDKVAGVLNWPTLVNLKQL